MGVEAIGTNDPDIDVEVIALAAAFYADLGLRQLTLRLTSLGDQTCRPAYRHALQEYLMARRAELCDEHKDRIAENPLRILDCKRDACINAAQDAPRMLDALCDECAAHFDRVKEGLDAAGIVYAVDRDLVRGLDYYTRTTFEFAASGIESAQNAVGGGGRYDGLIEQLGGPPTPGIGFGLGVERILSAVRRGGSFPRPLPASSVRYRYDRGRRRPRRRRPAAGRGHPHRPVVRQPLLEGAAQGGAACWCTICGRRSKTPA